MATMTHRGLCRICAPVKHAMVDSGNGMAPSRCQAIARANVDLLSIGSSHQSHNALDKYPIMHNFVTEICTHVHISVTK